MHKAVNSLSSQYENLLITWNFDDQASDTSVKDFFDICSFKHLLKKPTCYENPINPEYIDLMQ